MYITIIEEMNTIMMQVSIYKAGDKPMQKNLKNS